VKFDDKLNLCYLVLVTQWNRRDNWEESSNGHVENFGRGCGDMVLKNEALMIFVCSATDKFVATSSINFLFGVVIISKL
jgi:hypothetical protein